MARTSVRSSATRGQASSPPQRRTRSQSAGINQRSTPKRAGNRVRQSSVESERSNSSVQSNSRTRRATRRAPNPELSMVDEGPENNATDEEIDDEQLEEQDGKWALTDTSPRGSQYSGTTAHTTHSQATMQGMHATEIVDHLPELFSTACGLLDMLAPKKVSTEDMKRSLEYVGGVLRDVNLPGSRLSKNLTRKEDLFKSNKEHYGATKFIDLQLTIRKLFNSPNPSAGDFRPDEILYAANLAIALKDILVELKDNLSTHIHLRLLETNFPQAFLSSLNKNNALGESRLFDESFDLALDILTQAVIADLLHAKKDEDVTFDPDQILASSFYGSTPDSDVTMETLDDFYHNEPIRDIMWHVIPNSNAQKAKIRKRVSDIRKSFRNTVITAVENGDLVDFEELNDRFPWLSFVTNIVVWSRMRLDEIISSIEKQGGSQRIAELLEEIVDSQSLAKPALNLPRLQAAPEIGRSNEAARYNEKAQLLQKYLKSKTIVSSESASAQERLARQLSYMGPSSIAGSSRPPPVGLSESSGNNLEAQQRKSGNQASQIWEKDFVERNKENLSFHGTANATKLTTTKSETANSRTQPEASGPSDGPERSSRKHSRNITNDEESDMSEDAGFQSDSRIPNPSKRAKLSASRSVPVAKISNKGSLQGNESEDSEDEITRQNELMLQKALQLSAQGLDEGEHVFGEEEDSEPEDENVNDNVPPSTQIIIAARHATYRAKVARPLPVRKRTPWSAADESHLIDLIENYKTSWALILGHASFDREETQVGIKDKARNLKVAMLKANPNEADLPLNFDRIPLGRKERQQIKIVHPHLFPEDD